MSSAAFLHLTNSPVGVMLVLSSLKAAGWGLTASPDARRTTAPMVNPVRALFHWQLWSGVGGSPSGLPSCLADGLSTRQRPATRLTAIGRTPLARRLTMIGRITHVQKAAVYLPFVNPKKSDWWAPRLTGSDDADLLLGRQYFRQLQHYVSVTGDSWALIEIVSAQTRPKTLVDGCFKGFHMAMGHQLLTSRAVGTTGRAAA